MQFDQNATNYDVSKEPQDGAEPAQLRGSRTIDGRAKPPKQGQEKVSPKTTQKPTYGSKSGRESIYRNEAIDKNGAEPKIGRGHVSRHACHPDFESLLLMDKIEEVLITLRRLIRATDLHSKQLVKTAGLTAPQLLLLQAIREQGQVTIGALAKEISLSQATVTTILDRLEKRGLVYRERSSEDKRKVHAYLTEKGADIIRDAPTPLQEHFVKQFRDLREWEQSMIISSLQRVALMMDAEHIDASPVLDVGDLDRKDSRNLPPQEDK